MSGQVEKKKEEETAAPQEGAPNAQAEPAQAQAGAPNAQAEPAQAQAGAPNAEAEPALAQAKPAEAAAAAPDAEAELARARAQAAEYLDQWRRTAADFANYRKRIEKEREEAARFAGALLVSRLLPVLDDLERAMASLPVELRLLTWVDGVSLVERKLELVLEGEGLKPIAAAGQPFDPTRHEAVIREETAAHPDGQVIAELQRGYELRGRVLRPALVKVAVAPTPQAAPAEAEAEQPAAPGPDEARP